MGKKHGLWLLEAAVSVAVMILIVHFSAQSSVESNNLSQGLVAQVLALVQMVCPDADLVEVNFLLRKLAHFTLYFALGFSLTGVFSRQRRMPPVLAALLAGACFAASDELHQLFSQGRSASIADVLLDTCGMAAGSLMAYGVGLLLHKRGFADKRKER